MESLSVRNAQNAGCFIVFCFISFFKLFSQTPDFKVQHIQDDVAISGAINTTFSAVSSLNSAIELGSYLDKKE